MLDEGESGIFGAARNISLRLKIKIVIPLVIQTMKLLSNPTCRSLPLQRSFFIGNNEKRKPSCCYYNLKSIMLRREIFVAVRNVPPFTIYRYIYLSIFVQITTLRMIE